MDKLLLRPGEVSDLTGMGKSKTYALIATGVIPSVRIGRSVRVPADRLRRWIEELHVHEQAPPKSEPLSPVASQFMPGKKPTPSVPSINGAPTAKRQSQSGQISDEP